jgi:hypothetical protein
VQPISLKPENNECQKDEEINQSYGDLATITDMPAKAAAFFQHLTPFEHFFKRT